MRAAWGALAIAWTIAAGPAFADEPRALRSTADLDGRYLVLGPVGGARHSAEGWDTSFGGMAGLLRVREQRFLAAHGVFAAVTRDAEARRAWITLEGVAGTRRVGGVLVGVGAGGAVRLADISHPSAAATVSLWAFLGPTPFVRIALGTGERMLMAGVAIALPAKRW